MKLNYLLSIYQLNLYHDLINYFNLLAIKNSSPFKGQSVTSPQVQRSLKQLIKFHFTVLVLVIVPIICRHYRSNLPPSPTQLTTLDCATRDSLFNDYCNYLDDKCASSFFYFTIMGSRTQLNKRKMSSEPQQFPVSLQARTNSERSLQFLHRKSVGHNSSDIMVNGRREFIMN